MILFLLGLVYKQGCSFFKGLVINFVFLLSSVDFGFIYFYLIILMMMVVRIICCIVLISVCEVIIFLVITS
jgi:hypothetical protein